MTVADLQNLIKETDYLNSKQKAEFLKLLPKMGIDEASDLANTLLWAQEQGQNLDTEKDLIVTGLNGIFTELNKNALKEAKKAVAGAMQSDQSEEDEKEMDKLLTELKDA